MTAPAQPNPATAGAEMNVPGPDSDDGIAAEVFDCAQCGHEAFTTDTGVAHHASEDTVDGVDHDADADHVPFPEPPPLL